MARGASLTTDKHVDPAAAPKIIEEENVEIEDADVPEGAIRFDLSVGQIEEALAAASTEVILRSAGFPN